MSAEPWALTWSEGKPRLTPHPWDAIAERIYPGAQTVDEAEAALRKGETERLVDDVMNHREEARYLADRIEDETREGDEARDRLVAAIGEAEAREALGEDNWNGLDVI